MGNEWHSDPRNQNAVLRNEGWNNDVDMADGIVVVMVVMVVGTYVSNRVYVWVSLPHWADIESYNESFYKFQFPVVPPFHSLWSSSHWVWCW